jgi:hypothetical protein
MPTEEKTRMDIWKAPGLPSDRHLIVTKNDYIEDLKNIGIKRNTVLTRRTQPWNWRRPGTVCDYLNEHPTL